MPQKNSRFAFIFPGQGTQYPGMGQDFVHNFSAARLTFEEADDLLQFSLSKIILQGPENVLTETKNSQLAIYVTSVAILRVVQELYNLKPTVCAGLSLGEYTALTAGEWLSFQKVLPLVQKRGELMNEACQTTQGTMAAVLGLSAQEIENVVQQVNLPQDLWIANFNCPGQVVLSGTAKGIEKGSEQAKLQGAKKVILLQVSGAFHSGLMTSAEKKFAPFIEDSSIQAGLSKLAMNVPGAIVEDRSQIKNYLIKQVTHSVRWEQSIRQVDQQGIDFYIELGPRKTLAAFNKRIEVVAPTLSIEKIEDLDQLKHI